MTDWKAHVWDKLLTAYGQAPYHPGKWRLIKRLQRRAEPAWDGTRVVCRRGVMYELDVRDYLPRWVFLNTFEVWETSLIERIVKPGWTAVDVGANIGYYTGLLCRLVGPAGSVYAFEPTQRCYANLERNISLNGFGNVHTFREAVGNASQEVTLTCADDHHPSKTCISIAGSSPGEIAPMIPLDRFVREQDLARLDFMKIDIEGAEGLLLSGADETLTRFKPILMIELNPAALSQFGSSPAQIVELLRGYGYHLFRTTWHGLVRLDRLPCLGQYWNVFAFPNSTVRTYLST